MSNMGTDNHGMNKIKDYPVRYCTECETVCHMYEQGLTCNCSNPWDSEILDEKDYPVKWIKAYVYLYDQENFMGRLDTFTFTFGKYKGKRATEVILIDPQYILWCHNDKKYVDWFDLHDEDLQMVIRAIERKRQR